MPDPATMPNLGLGAVKELLEAFNATDVAELTLEHGEFRLSMKKPSVAPVVYQAPVVAAPPAAPRGPARTGATRASPAPACRCRPGSSP